MRGGCGGLSFAIRCASVTRGRRNGLALRVGLLRIRPQGCGKSGQVRFAVAIARGNDGGQIVVDRVFERIEHILGQRRSASVNKKNSSVLSHPSRPFHIEVGLNLIPAGKTGAGIYRHQLQIGRRKSRGTAEGVNVSGVNLSLARDGNLHSRSSESGGVKGLDVVDCGKVTGGNEMVPGNVRCEIRSHRDPCPGPRAKIL